MSRGRGTPATRTASATRCRCSRRSWTASRARDVAALAELYDDDVVWLAPDGTAARPRGRPASATPRSPRGRSEWSSPQQHGARAALRWVDGTGAVARDRGRDPPRPHHLRRRRLARLGRSRPPLGPSGERRRRVEGAQAAAAAPRRRSMASTASEPLRNSTDRPGRQGSATSSDRSGWCPHSSTVSGVRGARSAGPRPRRCPCPAPGAGPAAAPGPRAAATISPVWRQRTSGLETTASTARPSAATPAAARPHARPRPPAVSARGASS